MQTWSNDENSIRPSDRLSVCPLNVFIVIKRKKKYVHIPYERSFNLVFWEKEWLVGATPSTPEIFGQPALVRAKSPLVAPQP